MMPAIEIDDRSGFCFGVVTAINKAEDELSTGQPLYCIGDIVHNTAEVERLRGKGLVTIDHAALDNLNGIKVLLRAHGEPPSTYTKAREHNISIVDATCPVVLKLQQRIKEAYANAKSTDTDLQIVIYGQPGHAEVNGLVGQTDGTAIVVADVEQLSQLDFTRPIALYSQTTKSLEGFQRIIKEIQNRLHDGIHFEYYDTICRQVSNRVEHLREFAAAHDVVLFVAGEKSSNGRILFSHCLQINPRSKLVPGPEHIQASWLENVETVGICGATSTPRWLMEEVAARARQLCS